MNYSGSAPVLQPVPEPPEHDLPVTPGSEEVALGNGKPVAHRRLLWEHRQLLVRVVFYGLLANALLAFLVAMRFDSTARLIPSDYSESGGLDIAAAATSGSTTGWGGIASEMLGLKRTTDMFVGISGRKVRDKLIQQFDLDKLYQDRRTEDARKEQVVLESSANECEMAKVQEVKEIPVVKVVDAPNISDKKLFAPRLFLGTALPFALDGTWALGKTTWEQPNSAEPGMAFAQEVFTAVKARVPNFARNSSGNHLVERKSASWISVLRGKNAGQNKRLFLL